MSGIRLTLSQTWQGLSQRPGQRRARVLGRDVIARLPRVWRMAAAGFTALTVLYGLAVGGYFGRTADYATKNVSTLLVRAGFAVNRVTLEGQNRISDEAVIHALGIDRNTSTLAFDTASAKERLEKLPIVRSAQVMRLLPSQLHVVIEERVPYAVWQNDGKLYLVDQDGRVIESLEGRTDPDLPLVVGEGAAENARGLLDELAHWPQVKSKVQAAIRVADRRWNLKLQNGLEIRLPENHPARALKKVAELDETHRILSGEAVAVDLRLADRVTIRLKDDTASRRDSVFSKPAAGPRKPGQDT